MIDNFEIEEEHVGSKVFSMEFGNGLITFFEDDEVELTFEEHSICYRTDGKFELDYKYRTMFFGHKKDDETLIEFLNREEYPIKIFKENELVMVKDIEEEYWHIRAFDYSKEKGKSPYYVKEGSSWKYCKKLNMKEYLKQFN